MKTIFFKSKHYVVKFENQKTENSYCSILCQNLRLKYHAKTLGIYA